MVNIKWKHKPNGACPVQAEGWINGRAFYFRSRGSKSTIEIAYKKDLTVDPASIIMTDKAAIHVLREYDGDYEAGCIDNSTAMNLIVNFAIENTNPLDALVFSIYKQYEPFLINILNGINWVLNKILDRLYR